MVTTAGSVSYSTRTSARSLFGGVEGLGRDGGDRLAVVVRLADGDHRAVPELGSEPRDRLRQVGGGEDEADAGHGEGGRRVDRDDPRPRDIDRDELGVEDAIESKVGDVDLASGDPVEPADPGRGIADPSGARHRRLGASCSAASSTASKICS